MENLKASYASGYSKSSLLLARACRRSFCHASPSFDITIFCPSILNAFLDLCFIVLNNVVRFTLKNLSLIRLMSLRTVLLQYHPFLQMLSSVSCPCEALPDALLLLCHPTLLLTLEPSPSFFGYLASRDSSVSSQIEIPSVKLD